MVSFNDIIILCILKIAKLAYRQVSTTWWYCTLSIFTIENNYYYILLLFLAISTR